MKVLRLIANWLSGLFILLIAILTLWSNNYFAFIPLFLISLLLIPLSYRFFFSFFSKPHSSQTRCFLIFFFVLLLLGILGLQRFNRTSIFNSEADKTRIMDIYENKLQQWYIPFESTYLKTSFGDVQIISCGDPDNPPALLLPDYQMAAWTWIYNIVNLNKNYHTFAIDIIGETGKSQLDDLNSIPYSDQDIRQHYNEIMDKLQLDSAIFIGVSQGAYLALRYAKTEPDRVEKLVLIAPLGFTRPLRYMPSLILARVFPVRPFIALTCDRLMGKSPIVRNLCQDWLYASLQGVSLRPAPPRLFTHSELNNINVPILIILGDNDKIVGKPDKIIPLAANLPEIKIEILNSGHLINIENSGEVNKLINSFLIK